MADVVQEKLLILRSKLDRTPIFAKAEEITHVPKEYLVVGGGVLLTIFIFLGVGAGTLCSIVGFIYPAFKSFEAIEIQKNTSNDRQWLSYWIIFSFFSIIELFVDFLLYWIPFYYAFKLAFLLWAMLPQTKGAKFMYDSFLKDFLKNKESSIDAAMANAKKNAGVIVSEFASASGEVVGAAVDAGLKQKETKTN